MELASDIDDLEIRIDNLISRKDLFVEIAYKLMNKNHGLDVLSHKTENTKYEDLPSWVPDWTLPTNYSIADKQSIDRKLFSSRGCFEDADILIYSGGKLDIGTY
ncbi:hypothetical protein BDY21DRAFT_355481 [Lineolata rhizophorae]|uniref:Uncharacterized protein n=1 Tax=Lineolata rhizophorae TaxID=578093 RepID=A0A6A6NQA6_9PEZI|nr:hypothetical protein BDY21DRAFT_355481 [Lineolata rhizophorae]